MLIAGALGRVCGVVFAEIARHVAVQAFGGAAVADHAVEQLPFGPAYQVLFGRGEAFVGAAHVEQPAPCDDVRLVPQQRATAWLAVAARTAGLLIVRFDAFGHVVVDHKTHIRLVDAHAERVRGHHNRCAVGHEITLRLFAHGRGHAAVVGHRHVARRTARAARRAQLRHERVERLCECLGLFACGAVHDARFVRMLGHVIRDPVRFLARVEFEHVEIQVRAVEARDEHERVAQAQQLHDVAAHAFGRGGGERRHGGAVGQRGDEFADAQIRRAEVLAPLRNTVRFVHRDQRDVSARREIAEAWRLQTFGGHVEQLHLAGIGGVEHVLLFVHGLRGVDECGGDANLVRAVHLVTHQRDEWGDDDRDAVEQQRGNLVAHGFARARGHDTQHIAVGGDRLDEFGLTGAERCIAEVLAQCRQRRLRPVVGGAGLAGVCVRFESCHRRPVYQRRPIGGRGGVGACPGVRRPRPGTPPPHAWHRRASAAWRSARRTGMWNPAASCIRPPSTGSRR